MSSATRDLEVLALCMGMFGGYPVVRDEREAWPQYQRAKVVANLIEPVCIQGYGDCRMHG